MRILILGGNGMLGHYFLSEFGKRHEVRVTLRQPEKNYPNKRLFNTDNSFFEVDVTSIRCLTNVFQQFAPDAVVNATGVTKQLAVQGNLESLIEVNALVPHRLATLCKEHSARLIQFSSDCVFSGEKGNYSETDLSDATDFYGKTKFLGEIDQSHVVTLRKSTIGLELAGYHGLIEWFLAQEGEIKGFKRAIYSGLISAELVRVVELILTDFKSLSGVWNVASQPINKFDLLVGLQERVTPGKIKITPDETFRCDRSLDGSQFQKKTGYTAPSWNQMLNKLALEIRSRPHK